MYLHTIHHRRHPFPGHGAKNSQAIAADDGDDDENKAEAFNFRDLATATKNFKPECLIGEGDIGRVYKGILQSGQVTFS